MSDWDGVRLWGGGDAAQVRARLAAGADPCAPFGSGGRMDVPVGAPCPGDLLTGLMDRV
jgi:hypothetical protein